MWQTMEILRFCENSWSYHSQASSFDQEKMLSNMVKKINETGALKKEIVKNLMTTWIMRFLGRILTPGWEAAASSLQLHNTNSGAICHVAAPLLSCSSSSSPRGRRYYISICSVLILRIDNWVISTLGYIYWVISTLGILAWIGKQDAQCTRWMVAGEVFQRKKISLSFGDGGKLPNSVIERNNSNAMIPHLKKILYLKRP